MGWSLFYLIAMCRLWGKVSVGVGGLAFISVSLGEDAPKFNSP